MSSLCRIPPPGPVRRLEEDPELGDGDPGGVPGPPTHQHGQARPNDGHTGRLPFTIPGRLLQYLGVPCHRTCEEKSACKLFVPLKMLTSLCSV